MQQGIYATVLAKYYTLRLKRKTWFVGSFVNLRAFFTVVIIIAIIIIIIIIIIIKIMKEQYGMSQNSYDQNIRRNRLKSEITTQR